MADQRLPAVNGDDGQWGTILNQYLTKEHYNTGVDNAGNGGHKTITIRPGTATAGTAPLKFTSGTLLSTPEAGAIEFNNDTLYFTQTTGTAREKIASYDDTNGATGDIYYRDNGGNFVRLGIGSTNQVLTVASGLPVWGAAGGSSDSFETVSKNLKAYPFTLNYTSNVLTTMVYTVGSNSVTKTFNYTSGKLTSIVLSGSGLPSGITLTKTLGYTSNSLSSVSYA